MPNKVNWAGTVQGGLKVLKEAGRDRLGNVLWRCKCSCGTTAIVSGRALKGGQHSCSVSCGVTASNKDRATHGAYETREYSAWREMKQRCYNPNNARYADYGGRGVTVHPAWVKSFSKFIAHIGPAPEGTTLDRRNNNRGYVPGNVRWTDRTTQQNNMRSNVRIPFKGKVMTIAEWARHTGIPYDRIKRRYAKGMPLNKVFNVAKLPVR